MKLEKMFRRVHANSANLFHGRSPLFEICNDLILAQSMPSGAVHPITLCESFGSELSMTGVDSGLDLHRQPTLPNPDTPHVIHLNRFGECHHGAGV